MANGLWLHGSPVCYLERELASAQQDSLQRRLLRPLSASLVFVQRQPEIRRAARGGVVRGRGARSGVIRCRGASGGGAEAPEAEQPEVTLVKRPEAEQPEVA